MDKIRQDKTLFKVAHVEHTLANRLLHDNILQIYTVQNILYVQCE